VIRGTVEKLLETVEEPLERARLERVGRMADRLHRISESLLDFSRVRGDEQRRPAPLRSLLDEAWSLLALDDRASGVEFHNDVTAEAYALGDYERLMQVFVNLLKNGLYALDGPGSIRARSRQEIQGGRPWVVVEVDDSGKGIPADVLPNLFEAFVSTRLDSRGTGLGLTVADGIVQQHGGQIVAANRPEGGARLTVRLPAARAPKPAEAPAEV
jgi:signal transduction histidine kinase